MNKTLQGKLLNKLSPNGEWELSDIVKSLLKYYIIRLPKKEVTEEETRYPINPSGMRVFLTKFFSRHYLQTQNSLIKYVCSDDFINIVNTGRINILDVGSGPAVASLAITDIVVNIIKYLKDRGVWHRGKRLEFNYILNDTSNICLGTGQNMIKDYFNRSRHMTVTYTHLFSISKAFPDNMSQLKRISIQSGDYDIVTFSYVIYPLIEDNNFKSLIKGFLDIERLCSNCAGILILQDKYKRTLMHRLCNTLGVQSKKEISEQDIFPKRNDNETYTYTYYSCLYIPQKKMNKLSAVA